MPPTATKTRSSKSTSRDNGQKKKGVEKNVEQDQLGLGDATYNAQDAQTDQVESKDDEQEQNPKDDKPVYSHPTKLRCGRCGLLMRCVGTREGGKFKRWACPGAVCRHTATTQGVIAPTSAK